MFLSFQNFAFGFLVPLTELADVHVCHLQPIIISNWGVFQTKRNNSFLAIQSIQKSHTDCTNETENVLKRLQRWMSLSRNVLQHAFRLLLFLPFISTWTCHNCGYILRLWDMRCGKAVRHRTNFRWLIKYFLLCPSLRPWRLFAFLDVIATIVVSQMGWIVPRWEFDFLGSITGISLSILIFVSLKCIRPSNCWCSSGPTLDGTNLTLISFW